MLPLSEFAKVVENTPLVSIDLIVEDAEGRILLGKRNHSPAKGKWFVPGGRVLKNETILCAFQRLLREELNSDTETFSFEFHGLYQHLYDDSFFSECVSTHYVVLAYSLRLAAGECPLPPYKQHSEYRWLTRDDLLINPCVHTHTKWYFMSGATADSFLSGAYASGRQK